MRFTRHRKKVRANPDAIEAQMLARLAAELLELIEGPEQSDDPLAALVGLPPGEVHPPDNPVLARLLPDAYRDDPAAATDFRRYTDGELRRQKRASIAVMLTTLPEDGGTFDLDRDQVDAWLSALNDMRLALGTAHDVQEDTDLEGSEEPALHIYGWLGFLQESLLSCVDPRPSH
ncbi:MAG: hypothetical protein JWM40_1397 [Frankiales bacterium]|nr:hypothetical protein [Frankiales bacterium]